MGTKTEVEEVDKHTVIIKIEVPPEDIAGQISKAYREIAKKVRIPGFRKGKAPKPIIDQMVGKEAVLEEALQEIIPEIYPDAVKSSGVVPVTMPEVDVVQMKENEPLIFTAKVQVKPELTLGSLDDLEIGEHKKRSLADEVKSELEKLRGKFATLEVVKSRESRKGDFVLIDYEGFMEGKPFEGGRGSDFMLELGSGSFIPGFEDQLLGVKPNSDVEINLTFPADYQAKHMAGEDALFKVKLKEIKTKKLPKVDDELALSASKFDTLKELKADLTEKAKAQQEQQQKAAYRERALEKMVEISTVDLPDGMVERRVDQMVQSFAGQLKQTQDVTMESWLQQSGVNPQDFRNNYKSEAVKNLETELTLETVVKEHGLEATEQEIDAEIARLAEGSDQTVEQLKEEIGKREGYEFLEERLSMDKAVDFLAEKVNIKKAEEKDKDKEEKDKIDKKEDDADESSTDSN